MGISWCVMSFSCVDMARMDLIIDLFGLCPLVEDERSRRLAGSYSIREFYLTPPVGMDVATL